MKGFNSNSHSCFIFVMNNYKFYKYSLVFLLRKSWWQSQCLITTRLVRMTPLGKSLWAVRRPASVWSTGPTCSLILAAPLPSGIHCSQRRISTVSWRPWLQRSNMLHQPATALTQNANPHPYFAWNPQLNSWLLVMKPAQQKRDVLEYPLSHG